MVNASGDFVDFIKNLDECVDFPCIFGLVRSAVELTINRRRVGLILGLSNLPNHVGAIHQVGSNFIIMNRFLLKRVLASGDKGLVNAYVFHILLHEYIHSLGYVNEQETQILTHAISEQVLGPEHKATKIARYGIGSLFSKMWIPGRQNGADEDSDKGIELVRDIESDNLNYFG